MTKYDWTLIIAALLLIIYCFAAMITGVVYGWPFGNEVVGWFGSLSSVLLGGFLLILWLILVFLRAAALIRGAYGELSPEEKKVVGRVTLIVARELFQRAKRRKDKIGEAARTGERILRKA